MQGVSGSSPLGSIRISLVILISFNENTQEEFYSNGELRLTIDKDIQYFLTSNEVIKVNDDQYVFEIKTSINTDLAEIANKFCFS